MAFLTSIIMTIIEGLRALRLKNSQFEKSKSIYLSKRLVCTWKHRFRSTMKWNINECAIQIDLLFLECAWNAKNTQTTANTWSFSDCHFDHRSTGFFTKVKLVNYLCTLFCFNFNRINESHSSLRWIIDAVSNT